MDSLISPLLFLAAMAPVMQGGGAELPDCRTLAIATSRTFARTCIIRTIRTGPTVADEHADVPRKAAAQWLASRCP